MGYYSDLAKLVGVTRVIEKNFCLQNEDIKKTIFIRPEAVKKMNGFKDFKEELRLHKEKTSEYTMMACLEEFIEKMEGNLCQYAAVMTVGDKRAHELASQAIRTVYQREYERISMKKALDSIVDNIVDDQRERISMTKALDSATVDSITTVEEKVMLAKLADKEEYKPVDLVAKSLCDVCTKPICSGAGHF